MCTSPHKKRGVYQEDMLDYAVWCLVVPYLDAQSVVAVRRVHRDGRHPFPRDAARTRVRLVLNRSGKAKRVATAEAAGDVVVFEALFFKGFTTGPLTWGHREGTMCRHLARYVDLRACRVGTDGRVHVDRAPLRVASAMYALEGMAGFRLVVTLGDGSYRLVATRGRATVTHESRCESVPTP